MQSSNFEAFDASVVAHSLHRRPRRNAASPYDCSRCIHLLRSFVAHAFACVAWLFRSAALRLLGRPSSGSRGPVERCLEVGGWQIVLCEAADDGSYAGRLWHTSMVLAPFLVANAEHFEAAAVLELGAGTGLCSLAIAAAAPAAHVTASDVDQPSLALVEKAAVLQGLANVRTETFDICGKEPLPAADWLVASDVLYTPQLAEAMAARCAECISRGGRIILGDPDRPTRPLLQAALERRGLPSQFRRVDEAGGIDYGPTATRLFLVHAEGELSVSVFPAHAELEG